jgi:hypothetical protein
MKKDPRIFVHHILESIGLIEGYSDGKTFGGLCNLNIFARCRLIYLQCSIKIGIQFIPPHKLVYDTKRYINIKLAKTLVSQEPNA